MMEVDRKRSSAVVSSSDDFGASTNRERKNILEEETYVETLERIIQRDFFPDIAKLRAQAEYLEAVERNDVEKIRQLQMKYSRRRTDQIRHSRTPRQGSPESFETPDVKKRCPDTGFEKGESSESVGDKAESSESVQKISDVKEEGLDKFLAKYTSEDNASYGEIMDLAEQKRRQRLAWMFNAEKEHNLKLAIAYGSQSGTDSSVPALAIESGGDRTTLDNNAVALVPVSTSVSVIATTGSSITTTARPAAVDGWTYKAINSVMWVPEEVELTPEEKLKRKMLAEREILHKNTRFMENPFSESAAEETMNRALGLHAAVNKGRVDVHGCEVGVFKRPGTQFSYVVTPSPMPGVNESPMMTWGEIEGTPFRLDASDLPIAPGTNAGPSFKIPETPVRDTLALNLAEEASKRYRQRKEKAVREVTHNFASPAAKFGSAKSIERLKEMSPAARRLATSKLGIRLSTDRALKASYTPSPLRARGEKTPILSSGTPVNLRTPEASSPGSKRRTAQPESITDNLLKLSSDSSNTEKSSEDHGSKS